MTDKHRGDLASRQSPDLPGELFDEDVLVAHEKKKMLNDVRGCALAMLSNADTELREALLSLKRATHHLDVLKKLGCTRARTVENDMPRLREEIRTCQETIASMELLLEVIK